MSVPDTSQSVADDVRPVVATGNSGKLGLIAFMILMVIGGAWIFSLMAAQRASLDTNSELATIAPNTGTISSPPPLALPRDYGDDAFAPRPRVGPRIVKPLPNYAPRRSAYRPEPEARNAPTLTYTPTEGSGVPYLPSPAYSDAQSAPEPATLVRNDDGDRISAGRFRNPSVTVPQGTVIPAVLETALDSTRAGGVRALVQTDIHSFDGSRVLIHRGSRLYGVYEGDLQRGQNRALIRWTRLIRPDGITIALDSPASDPLGRAGVKGKVDSKFFQRFGGALLQSALDVGVGVAASRATDGVIVALPGSTQNVTPRASPNDVAPTLKVRHGTSVSVFVAHDLDFSGVET